MKILVTGATGFIGQNLVERLLKEEYEVLCVTRKPITENLFGRKVENIVLDLQEIEKLGDRMNGVDVVIHMAAQLGHYGIPYEYFYQVNYMASVKLAKLAIQYGVKHFILCSAPFVVGLGKRSSGEDEPYAPKDAYSETKMLAELGIINVCEGRIPYTILRPSYVYGKGDVRRISLYKSIEKRYFVLTTSGKAYIHPTYVSDIVDGFLLAIMNENAYGEIFNLGAEKDCTALEYLQCIAENVGSRLIQINIGYGLSVFCADMVDIPCKKIFHKAGFVNRGRIDFFAKDHSCNINKAKEKLGYRPAISLEEGVRLSIEWARDKGYM